MKNTKWIAGIIICVGIILFFIRTQSSTPNPLSTTVREGEQQKKQDNPNLTKSPTKKLMLKNTTIDLLVAETPDENMWGLSDFPSLPPDTGMMFVFPQPGIHSFWMKDMKFSLDMIWLDSDNRVITIHENINPDTYLQNPPELFRPVKPASAVIEVPGGFVKEYGVRLGEVLEIINKN
jgi:uncharacterized membrane protein (UPF0127 family)